MSQIIPPIKCNKCLLYYLPGNLNKTTGKEGLSKKFSEETNILKLKY